MKPTQPPTFAPLNHAILLQPGARLVVDVSPDGIPEIAGILDAAGIAPGPDVVGRVRALVSDVQGVREICDPLNLFGATCTEYVRGMADRAEASGYAHDALESTVKILREERDEARAKVKALDEERADLARRLNALHNVIADFDPGANPGPDGFPDRLRELLSGRPKPAGPVVEWFGNVLYVNDSSVGHIYQRRDGLFDAHAARASALGLDEPAARAMLLLLSGHDPGGRWTVARHTVPVDVVRAVCGTVAVGWEAP